MKLENLTMATVLSEQIKRYETAQRLLRLVGNDDKDSVVLAVIKPERAEMRYDQERLDSRVDINIHPNIIAPFIQAEVTRLKQALRDMGVELE